MRNHLVRQVCLHGISLADVQTATSTDNTLQTVIRFVEHEWPHQARLSTDILPYFHVHSELEYSNVGLAA